MAFVTEERVVNYTIGLCDLCDGGVQFSHVVLKSEEPMGDGVTFCIELSWNGLAVA